MIHFIKMHMFYINTLLTTKISLPCIHVVCCSALHAVTEDGMQLLQFQ